VARGKSKTTYLDIPQKPDESDYLDADGNLDSKAYFNATEGALSVSSTVMVVPSASVSFLFGHRVSFTMVAIP